ncbi:hypothetical protein N8482_03555 [Chitinophagales bacterium]|nr:hypothetical protein [Chitinophagales bacterium]
MKAILSLSIISLVFLLASCSQSDAPANTEKAKPGSATEQSGIGKVNTILHPKLQALLVDAEKLEYVFYKKGYSFSTETDETSQPGAVKNYFYHISPQIGPTNCKYDGGGVFRNTDGSIIMEMDFALKPDCSGVRLRFDGETHYQQLSESGVNALNQLFSIDPSQGTPKAK